jgi:hypothetical protein
MIIILTRIATFSRVLCCDWSDMQIIADNSPIPTPEMTKRPDPIGQLLSTNSKSDW